MLRAKQEEQGDLKALVGGTLIDGTGGTPMRDPVVIVEGERIAGVGEASTVGIGVTVGAGVGDGAIDRLTMGVGDGANTAGAASKGRRMPAL